MFNAVCITLGLIGLCLSSSARADDAEDKAAMFVFDLGGLAFRDNMAPDKPFTYVRLPGARVSDAALKELAPLKSLTKLDLDDTQVTDVGLKELAPFKNLSRLDLTRTKVTDAGLKELSPLENLTTLYLDDTR
jgi:internalin A